METWATDASTKCLWSKLLFHVDKQERKWNDVVVIVDVVDVVNVVVIVAIVIIVAVV